MKLKNVEVPVLDLRNIPRDRILDIVKPVKNRHSEINLPLSVGDIEGRIFISQILIDVFEGESKRPKITSPLTEEEQEFIQLTNTLELAFSTVDPKKTEESIKNARKSWEECLKKVNGDIEKARELYDQL
ncbi:MAG TPA: hypothetical protein C5S37_11055 [Methanophagales archaeon]|nr:hypothetical protein [Methanophagales archaeon]